MDATKGQAMTPDAQRATEPGCKRCGDKETRIDGYCDHYCQDVHALELEIERLRKEVAYLRAPQVVRGGRNPAGE